MRAQRPPFELALEVTPIVTRATLARDHSP
jgi:hypothetical protein